MKTRILNLIGCAMLGLVVSGCELREKMPPPTPVAIASVNVFSGEFQGRVEAYADVTGHLSGEGAQLIEPRQWREGYRLYIEINEQLPAGDGGNAVKVPFQRRVPVEISGLEPGVYIVNVNGQEEHLEIDGAGLRPAVDRGQFL